jgi:hypothetical protein
VGGYHLKQVTLGVIVLLTACQNPVLTFSGGKLRGIETHATCFDFARDHQFLQLEVRPDDPYSVILRVVMRGDQLYIDAAENRRWHQYMKSDQQVRIKLGDNIYRASAIEVTSPELIETFIQGRTIYELVPR